MVAESTDYAEPRNLEPLIAAEEQRGSNRPLTRSTA
jgi:hypothetical protein